MVKTKKKKVKNEEVEKEKKEKGEESEMEDEESEGNTLTVKITENQPDGPSAGTIRVFTKEETGKDFRKAAEAYRKKFNGEYVK